MKNQITPPFTSALGVKQGCVLSPLLFNLFLRDLPEALSSEECKAPTLWNRPLSCLQFADDVVILSETAEGLQSSLKNLEIYCNHWNLEINSEKTKNFNIHQL